MIILRKLIVWNKLNKWIQKPIIISNVVWKNYIQRKQFIETRIKILILDLKETAMHKLTDGRGVTSLRSLLKIVGIQKCRMYVFE
jgi:hypothetical protein